MATDARIMMAVHKRHHDTCAWVRLMMRTLSMVSTVACTILLYTSAARAQNAPSPLVRGMVVDAKHAPLAGVLITAIGPTSKFTFQVYTDSAGEFLLRDLPAEVPYLVDVRKPGFLTAGARLTPHLADTVDLPIMLANDTMTPAASLSAQPLLQGTVVDSTQAPIAGVVITVVDSLTDRVVFKTNTDATGRFTFDHPVAVTPYFIIVRRIGSIEKTEQVTLRPADTLHLKFVLTPVSRLAAVRVTAEADLEYHDITSAEIAKANVPMLDAYDIVLRLRPFLLGNPFKGCMTDTSKFTFGPERPPPDPGAAMAQNPTKFTMGVGSFAASLFKNGGWLFHRKSNGASSEAAPPPDSTHPFHLYINGALRDGPPGAKNILSQIPVDDIDEMRYIDCLDTKTPQYRNSLMIILKPGKIY